MISIQRQSSVTDVTTAGVMATETVAEVTGNAACLALAKLDKYMQQIAS